MTGLGQERRRVDGRFQLSFCLALRRCRHQHGKGRARILPSTLKEDAYHHEISALAAMDEMGLEMVSARSRRVDNRLGLWTSHLPFGYFATPQKFTKSVRFV
jgi:hypothetical protein